MKELRFEDLYPQEYYFEQNGYDCRIAIKKLHDARDTMGMAQLSLSYIDDTESKDLTKNFVKAIHLRHAIEDLNNSFDLLLQIPWMFFRAWSCFNTGGSLRTGGLRNKAEIIRNTDDWVYIAEESCTYTKVQAYLQAESSPLYQKIKDFNDAYISIDTSGKTFTIRELCNTLKHRHALQFKELYEPYEFKLNINGEKTNLRDSGLGISYHQEFFDESNPGTALGKVSYEYTDDLSVDLEFYQGDSFRYVDCSEASKMFGIKEVYDECCLYFDALVDLYEEVYAIISPHMQLLHSFVGTDGKPNIKKNPDTIDLNKYFMEA